MRYLSETAHDIRILEGVISLPDRRVTAEQQNAVEYLIDEWDFTLAGPERSF